MNTFPFMHNQSPHDTDRNLGSRSPRRILQSDGRARGLGVQCLITAWGTLSLDERLLVGKYL